MATVSELKAALDAAGAEYRAKATKDELEALLASLEAPEAAEDSPEPEAEPEEAPEEDAPETVRAVIVSRFIDRHTGALRLAGDVVEVTPERFQEMNLGKERARIAD